MRPSFRISSFLLLIAALLTPLSIDARTWRITVDGTGDAPSIEAAMDSAAAWDTVLVAPGQHVIERVFLADGVVLIGEEGPTQTRLVPYPNPIGGVQSRLVCRFLSRTTQISGFWFEGFGDEGAISASSCYDVAVSECVFVHNEIGIAVYADYGNIRIRYNTFFGNWTAIDNQRAGGHCVENIIWDRAYGLDGLGVVCNDILDLDGISPFWRQGNFSLDPQFCGVDDYRIMASSPCAPGNVPLSNPCGFIGALPVGCAPTPVQERTWGGVKALYWK